MFASHRHIKFRRRGITQQKEYNIRLILVVRYTIYWQTRLMLLLVKHFAGAYKTNCLFIAVLYDVVSIVVIVQTRLTYITMITCVGSRGLGYYQRCFADRACTALTDVRRWSCWEGLERQVHDLFWRFLSGIRRKGLARPRKVCDHCGR
jgi:hypothetical protein